jgi:rod shape-determining protein MreD
MKVKWSWKKGTVILFLALASNAVQGLLAPLWHYNQPYVDFPLLITILYASTHHSSSALFMGWLTGMIQDLASGGALGVNAIPKLVVAYLVITLEEKVEIQELWPVQLALLVFYVTIAGIIGYVDATHLLQRKIEGGVFSTNFLFSLIINPLVYLILFQIPMKIKRRKGSLERGG